MEAKPMIEKHRRTYCARPGMRHNGSRGENLAMDQVDLIVEKRDAIKAACAKYGATAVRVFGSCARDDYDENSDIDVLVLMPENMNGFEWAGKLGDLEDELKALLGVEVDVVDEASLTGRTRERILKEAVSL